ncbi:MAG: hypothetical protein GY941_10605 [Planctomycetes bacterium]|nr:hypothetical protein [Planctomycetota bacterium]
MKAKQRLLSFLIAGFIIFPAISTFASDDKVYPGVMGVKSFSGHPDPIYSWGSIGNPSYSSDLDVYLPVIHDHIEHDIKGGWVHVKDYSDTQNIRCNLYTVYRWGTGVYVKNSGYKYSNGYGSSAQAIYFNNEVKSLFPSHYYYRCRIPKRTWRGISLINSYKVNEY